MSSSFPCKSAVDIYSTRNHETLFLSSNDGFAEDDLSLFFHMVSNFNILKTDDFGQCWVVLCFHNPPNSDMDYGVFNVCVWSFCMCVHTWRNFGHIRRTSCRIFIVLDSGEKSRRAQILARNGHSSMWWPRSIALSLAFKRTDLALRHQVFDLTS